MIKDSKVSLPRINTLDSRLRQEVIDGIVEAEKKLPSNYVIRVTQALRTIADQDALYAQGRTKPGKKVTNVRGGNSWHNYGLAFDFVLLIDGKISWDVDKYWLEVVKIFKSKGFVWGGDFKSLYDAPHFEKTFGKSLKDMK